MITINYDTLIEYLSFNEDGSILWNKDVGYKYKKGEVAGRIDAKGYSVVKIQGRRYRVHRLVYFYHTREWPPILDHVNRDRKDNRFCNLRPSSSSHNSANSNEMFNKNGYRGVQEHKGSYRANIKKEGERFVSRVFDTPYQAHQEYLRLREELYPGLVD